MATVNEDRALLNASDAGHYMSVSAEWIRLRERQGEIPSVRMGHTVRFRIEDLDQYIEDHLVEVD